MPLNIYLSFRITVGFGSESEEKFSDLHHYLQGPSFCLFFLFAWFYCWIYLWINSFL